MYKTYSFYLDYNDIQDILEKKGYTIKTLSKVIDMIPELKKKKKLIFRRKDSMGRVSSKVPPAFQTIRLAWKKVEEPELFFAVEELERKYQEGSYKFSGSLCKQDIFGEKILDFFMERVLGKMIREQVNIVIA